MKRSCWIALLAVSWPFYADAQQAGCVPVSSASVSPHPILGQNIPDIAEGLDREYDLKILDKNGNSIDGSNGPSCEVITLTTSTTTGFGSAGFPGAAIDGSTSSTFDLNTTATFPVVGTERSSSANNISLALSGTSNVSSPVNLTVVAVDISPQASAGNVTSYDDNRMAASNYGLLFAPGRNAPFPLGPVINYGNSRCAVGVEVAMKVHPSDYMTGVAWARITTNGAVYSNDTLFAALGNNSDFDNPQYEDPQPDVSGNIYDLDATGVTPSGHGSTARIRVNFTGQVVFGTPGLLYNGTNQNKASISFVNEYLSQAQITQPVKFFVRASCAFAPTPPNAPVNFLNDVPGDNLADLGCTPTSANLTGSCPTS